MTKKQVIFDIAMTDVDIRNRYGWLAARLQDAFINKKCTAAQLKIQYPVRSRINPVFMINVALAVAHTPKDGKEDLPDLPDVLETTLPWVGISTFHAAHRQFRNKNCIMAVVDVILEFDGHLYRLYDMGAQETLIPRSKPDPLIYTRQFMVDGQHHPVLYTKKLSELSDVEAKEHCIKDGAIHPGLIDHLRIFGFEHVGGKKYYHVFESEGVKLMAYEYGAVLDF